MNRRMMAIALLLLTLGQSGVTGAGAAASDDAAWAALRARVPGGTPLYRPTWLPPRFRQAAQYAASGPIVGVSYRSEEGDNILFIVGGSNSCSTTADVLETVLVQGVIGQLARFPTSCYPQITANWLVGDASYTIAGNKADGGRPALSREELLFVIAGLAPTAPGGGALPGAPLGGRAGGACFAETGQCAAGPFMDYWRANGGLARNGYPLTGEMLEQLEDGRLYQVQYFERVRLEWHPESADANYRILLGQFGRRVYTDISGRAADPPVAPKDGLRFFLETGHNIDGRFLDYWQRQGGLAQFGLPLTEQLTQEIDGKTYTVQYFERARFELHPENAAPYDVLLGQFGSYILTNR